MTAPTAAQTSAAAAPVTETIEIATVWRSGPDEPDPFRYGWRYIRHTDEHGGDRFEQVPLTLEDVLHPQEEDFIVHSEAHEWRNVYLYDLFRARVVDDPTAVVLHDCRVAWDVPGLRAHGPDIAVIVGVRERKNWATFDVAVEGMRPALIVEVTSPETASLDRSNKVDGYERAGVPLYVIVDTALPQRSAIRLLAYALTERGYQPYPADARGRLWLSPVRLWLGVADDEIICYDEADQPIGDYTALTAALAAAEQRITEATAARDEAEDRAAEAETRLRALEAELRRLRGQG